MSSSIFGTATSALLASQRALTTTSHNVANANTEGYSRQSVDFATREPFREGPGFVGTGVEVDRIRRAYDRFVATNLGSAIAGQAKQSELAGLAGEVDNVLADPAAGLTPALNGFFGSIQDVANDPTSTAARTAALSEAGSLASRFDNLDSRFDELDARVQSRISSAVAETNETAASLAGINREILEVQGSASEPQPNDLLDERDRLVNRLVEQVGASSRERADGAVDVFIGQGQAVVVGTEAMNLAVNDNRLDPGAPPVTLAGTDATINVGSFVGGRLGGLVEFGSSVLEPARNALGRIALGVTEATNATQRLGLDLDGAFGEDFFRPIGDAARVAPGSDNTGSASVSASVVDADALTTSDYRLSRSGATFNLERLADGQVTDVSAALGGGAPASVTVDGVEISLDSGSMDDGDRFQIQPTRDAAAAFDVALADGRDIAAAGAVRSSVSAGNTGSAAITQPETSSTTGLPLSSNGGPIELAFDAGANEFTVTNGPGGTLAYDPAADASGRSYSLAGFGGMEFTISGVPADGDRLTITDNSGSQGDNRNALRMAGVEQAAVLDGGNASVGEAYGSLVAEVGTRTRSAQTAEAVQSTRLDAARAERDAVSGVNLDEEAANLLRFQQSYEASARVVAVANELFDTLLRAVSR